VTLKQASKVFESPALTGRAFCFLDHKKIFQEIFDPKVMTGRKPL
jgi:hypothetical protein